MYGRGDLGVQPFSCAAGDVRSGQELVHETSPGRTPLRGTQPTAQNLDDHLAAVDRDIGHCPQVVAVQPSRQHATGRAADFLRTRPRVDPDRRTGGR